MNTTFGRTPQGRLDSLPPLPDALPDLPEAIPESALTPSEMAELPTARLPENIGRIRTLRSLRGGCYLINFTPAGSRLSTFDGTLRVEANRGGRTVSGDLYSRPVILIPSPRPLPPRPVLGPGPDPADGIPILARNRYRGYLRVTQVLEHFTLANSFILGFGLHRFDAATRSWSLQGPYTARMAWMTAPAGYPSAGDYLEGDVKDAAGTVVGRLTMGWVSRYLRRATIEIDRVSASETPQNNGAGTDWRTIFDRVGWDITLNVSDLNVTEPSGEGWSDAELHAGMLAWRATADLDTQWRYHLLCVRRLDSTSRGIMYDAYGGDSNNVPREGAAISSHWQFTNDPVFPEVGPWGLCAGLRFGQSAPAYFRSAVHEIGHASMMFHPGATTGNHIMQVTPQIAANAVAPVQFPNNIEWAFSAEDERRLRHLPDVVVRPGTVLRFGTDVGTAYSGVPLSPLDVAAESHGIELQVLPVMEAVPIGAPARVNFRMVNTGTAAIPVPVDLGMKGGCVTGQVIDPSGTTRAFSPILRYLDAGEMRVLEPGEAVSDSLTLLRGPDGALFPSAGYYRIAVTASWTVGGIPVQASGECGMMVTAAINEEHARIALKLLTTPDTLLALVLGGDHVTDGIAAVQAALDNPVLHRHYAYIEAKRLSHRFRGRAADTKAAAALIKDDTVMSTAEKAKAAKMGVARRAGAARG